MFFAILFASSAFAPMPGADAVLLPFVALPSGA